MDTFLNSMSAKQALEWELHAQENLPFEEKLLIQIAYICTIFAPNFLKKKDNSGWSLDDFMPWKRKEQKKEIKKGNALVSSFKRLLLLKGDEKAKQWAKEEPPEKIKGSNGKMYAYTLEEFATRTKQPRRIRG